MITGKCGEWYQDKHIGGYFNENGELVVCEEYGLSDEDTDKYSIEVQNGNGYYDKTGKYIKYSCQ